MSNNFTYVPTSPQVSDKRIRTFFPTDDPIITLDIINALRYYKGSDKDFSVQTDGKGFSERSNAKVLR